jgi:dsDNA-specific endonuclease/ATPase MutS2
MENTSSKKLNELHQQSVEAVNDILKEKKDKLSNEQHAALHEAHNEWQVAWNKLLNARMVIDKLEI